MLTIDWSNAIKKDFKQIRRAPRHAKNVDKLLEEIVTWLAEGKPLPERCRDHALIGDWEGYRECHVKPDLLLIYHTNEPGLLRLARLGSHSELFG